MTLQDQGFRYLVHRDTDRYGWIHPATVAERLAEGWTDCTDMSDDELLSFMKGETK